MDTTNSLAHTKWECKYHQMSFVEYIDPFTGEPVKKTRNKPLGVIVGNQSKPESSLWGSVGRRKH